MSSSRFMRLVRFLPLLLGLSLVACQSQPTPAPTPAVTATVMPTAGPTPTATLLPEVEPGLLALPAAFRYEMTLRPASQPEEPYTVVVGQYREGAWSQSTRHGEDTPEELVIAPGQPHSYTRAATDVVWTRWPGIGFDAAYGLASPFAVLRLYPLADEQVRGDADPVQGAPEATVKVQAAFAPATVERLLKASAAAVASDAEERTALEGQLAALLVPQTMTYWVGDSGRVYRAAATLLTADEAGEPQPWMEVTWRFYDYDSPAISVSAPADFADVSELAVATVSAQADPALGATTTLRVRVFSNPGQPAENARVSVYPAGKRQVLDELSAADAQFVLAEGKYDVLVQAEKAEEWLKEVEVISGTVTSQDVLFAFGTLAVTVTQDGATPQVDIVIYPAGQRQTMADWLTENPAQVLLPAGKYDIEVALPDYTGSKIVADVEVQAGQVTEQTIDITATP